MKFLGVELKAGSFDIWHKGNLTKLSQLQDDIGAVTPTAPEVYIGTSTPTNTSILWIDTN